MKVLGLEVFGRRLAFAAGHGAMRLFSEIGLHNFFHDLAILLRGLLIEKLEFDLTHMRLFLYQFLLLAVLNVQLHPYQI